MSDDTPPISPPISPPPKPGYRTTEFYLKLAAILLTALFASGAIPTTGTAATIAAIAATMLGALGYTVSRTFVKTAGVLLVLMLATQPLTACGASQREKTIHATYDATTAASDELLKYSKAHEDQIVKDAKSIDEGKASLKAWRDKVDHAEKDIDAVYRAIATAAILDNDKSIAALLQAAAVVSAELHDLGVAP